jgi:rhodanese-related sulfurtransferase
MSIVTKSCEVEVKMKSKVFWIITLVLLVGLAASACAKEATPTVAEEPMADEVDTTEAEEAEEMEMEEEPAALSEADLDAAFKTFLANMVGYNTVSLDTLNEMLAEEPPPFVLDVRSAEEVEANGRIESAVVIPLREVGKHTDQLPSFDITIVSYCGSGWRCTIAMTELGALGWQDVLSLKGGSFSGWVEAGYPVVEGVPDAVVLNAAQPDAALLARIDETLSNVPEGYGVITAEALNTEIAENPDIILLDVRRPEEVQAKGSIAGAISVPLESFIDGKADWPAEKDATTVVYCGSGHRSTIAMTILWTYGYSDVRSLKDGFGSWVDAGYAVAGGEAALDAAFNTFLSNMEGYNTYSIDALNTAIAEGNAPFMLDVRSLEEVESNGYIEGAIVVPLREVGENTDLLPDFDTTIVSYCGSGWRCTIAMTGLEALGYDVRSLKGGSFAGWVDAGYPVAEGVPEAEALNGATPDPGLLAVIDDMLSNVPEGYGVITGEALNTEIVENPDLILIDARRQDELEANGLIEGSISIPLESFIDGKADWPADKDAPIVVYCGSGHRSTIAMTILWTYGYSDVRSLKDGFGGWVNAGYPVVEYAMQ